MGNISQEMLLKSLRGVEGGLSELHSQRTSIRVVVAVLGWVVGRLSGRPWSSFQER